MMGDGYHINFLMAGPNTSCDFAKETTSALINATPSPAERKEAYACDITYGTNNELGFDYLRDNMVRSLDDVVQRALLSRR